VRVHPTIDELVALVASEGLPRYATPDQIALDDTTFAALVDVATSERITGHLECALNSGWLVATDDQRETARRYHEDALSLDLVLERLLARTSQTLRRAGIEHRALKGPVVARTAYPDPSLRSFGDVDILVDGRRFDDAIAVLQAEGGSARYREPRPNFTARYGKGVCVVTNRGLEIDVHRVFVSGPFGLAIDPRDLFADPDEIVVGDVVVDALPPEARFLHACYHAGLTNLRLTAARDVAQIACTTDLDVDRTLVLAERWRGRAVVQRALHLTRTHLRADLASPLYEWADRYVPDRFERAAMRPYAEGGRSYAAQMAAGMWALRGIRTRVAYGGALLFPDRHYVREREGGYVRRWARALSLARRSKGRA
jgi:Uncharacterised nucleotidyltransferase